MEGSSERKTEIVELQKGGEMRSRPSTGEAAMEAARLRPHRTGTKSKELEYWIGNYNNDYLYFDEPKEQISELSKKKVPKLKTRPNKFPNNVVNAIDKEETLKLFCICKRPDDQQRPMIQCDNCSNWFHFDCIGLNPVFLSSSIDFHTRRLYLRQMWTKETQSD